MPCRRILQAVRGAANPPSDEDFQAVELWADNKAVAVSLGGFLTTKWNSPLGSLSQSRTKGYSFGVLLFTHYSECGN